MTLLFELVAVVVLVLLNGFFVAAEYGLVTARRTRILELEHEGNKRAKRVLSITSDPPRFIAAMQLGVTLTSLAIGALGEQALAHALDPVMATLLAVILAFLLITFLHVVIGELVPKGIALAHSDSTALAVSGPVRGFFSVFGPLIWVLQRSTEFVLHLLGLEPPGAEGEVHSEAELKMLVSASSERGELEEEEQEMLYKVFDFADKEVADVMVPRPEVVALSIDLPPQECLAAIIDSPVHALPGLSRARSSTSSGSCTCATSSPRFRPGARAGERRGAAAPRAHGSRDQGPRGAADGVPPHWPAHGDRRRRVRRPRGDRHARGPARGDRRRDRGRVRPPGRVGRADRRGRRSASTGRSRSTTSTSSSTPTCRTRTTTRSPASSSASSATRPSRATRSSTAACASSARGRGLADREARGALRPRRARAGGRVRLAGLLRRDCAKRCGGCQAALDDLMRRPRSRP